MLAAIPAQAQSVSHGETLYRQTCNGCHGLPPVGGPERASNNPTLIAAAINGIAQMNFLRNVYSSTDLADIGAFINSIENSAPPPPPPPPPPPVPEFNYSDLWWNPGESGWGFNIIQHGTGTLFCVMFTYTAPDKPMWYVIPGGAWTSSTTFTGDVYQVTGSAANAATFVGSNATKVGTATMLFTSQNTANLTMSVNNTQAVKAIERQPF